MPILNKRANKTPLGLYVHVPFCRSKCQYCDFYSMATKDDKLMDGYLDAVCDHIKEAGELAPGYKVDSVSFGGGTPSFFGADGLAVILTTIRRNFDVVPDAEISVECNPDSVSDRLLHRLYAEGFNRVSLGVQSDDDEILKKLGRPHTYAQATTAYQRIRKAGFRNVSVDLMYGLPGQSEKEYIDSIERGGLLGVDHISAYSLILEEGTPLYAWVKQGRAVLPDDDAVYDMHRAGMARLESLGYKRYEISNYARPSCQCRHNINYWDVGEYIGLGLNSSSALRSKEGELIRFRNSESMDDYISKIENGCLPREDIESIGRENEMFEWIMLGLRKIEGVELGRFKARFGADVCEVYKEAVNKLENMGWLTVDQRFMRLTDRGLDMQNSALMEFMQ